MYDLYDEDTIEMFSCCICQELLADPVSLMCGHTHCQGCTETWLARKHSCPQCRAPVTGQVQCGVNIVLRNSIDILFPEGIEERKHRAAKNRSRAAARPDTARRWPVEN